MTNMRFGRRFTNGDTFVVECPSLPPDGMVALNPRIRVVDAGDCDITILVGTARFDRIRITVVHMPWWSWIKLVFRLLW